MTFYVNPELCIPALCTGFVVLVICTVANTVLNLVNAVLRADAAQHTRRNRYE